MKSPRSLRSVFRIEPAPASAALVLFLSAVLGLAGCNQVTSTESTTVEATLTLPDSIVAPDTIVWKYAGVTGVKPISAKAVSYAVSAMVPKTVGNDTFILETRTLSILTYTFGTKAGQEGTLQPTFYGTVVNSGANRLLVSYDSVYRKDPTANPWTRTGFFKYMAGLVLAGDARCVGYPKRAADGIDTALVDSFALVKLRDSKDSAGAATSKWLVGWTGAQLRQVYHAWVSQGLMRQGQYDTLFPFDDRPPTTVRRLGFSGTDDSTTIIRGGDAVQVVGGFADDTGIVSQSIKILSTPPGDSATDATMKFVVDISDFPRTPQQSWDLSGKLSIKTNAASNGLYRLVMAFTDRKGQVDSAFYNFSVHEPGGVAIDSIAPSIVKVFPASGDITLDDTTKTYKVRFVVKDENLKSVLLDGETVTPASDGSVEKVVALTEGKTSVVRISAVDSSKNHSSDSVKVTRKVAVLPTIVCNQPATCSETVGDTTYTYTFRWKVDGVTLDTILINGNQVLQDDQGLAKMEFPLKLGDTTKIQIHVVDRLRHVINGSISVYRKPSVPPSVLRDGIAAGAITVPDTQSFFVARWKVSDNNLDSMTVDGVQRKLVDGKCDTTVFLVAGKTTRISVWTKDKLGSVVTDTIDVVRPDPRAPYLDVIGKVQLGDSIVPLTDFVLPNVRFGRFEVTADLYAKVMHLPAPQTPGLPVANVNIYDAMLFCNAMSKAAGLDTFYTYTSRVASSGYLNDFAVRSDTIDPAAATKAIRKGFRLPTAVEWDAVANAWSTVHPWGASEDPQVVAQYVVWKNASAIPVGSRQPTGAGVFDLAGNNAEWVYRNRGNLDDLTSWLSRGGAFSSIALSALTTVDSWTPGTARTSSLGFRVVRIGKD